MADPISPSEPPNEPPVLHIGGLVISVATLQLGIAFVLSLLVLIGCFWVMLAPTDERSEQAAIALSTSVVTAWITRFGGQLLGRR